MILHGKCVMDNKLLTIRQYPALVKTLLVPAFFTLLIQAYIGLQNDS